MRDFNYVEDVIDAMLLVATTKRASGRVYNLGAEPVALKAFAEMLNDMTGCGFSIKPFPEQRIQIDIGSYYGNRRRICEELGWKPRTDLRVALHRTLEFYKAQLDHYV